MKQLTRSTLGQASGRCLSSLVLTAFVLLGAGVLSGFGGDAPNAPGSGAGASTFGGGGGDDETVGTLPTYNGGSAFDILRHARITRPSLYVQGTVDEVLSSAVVVRGDRRVLAQTMPGGQLRLTFLGDAQVGFDRNSFHTANLRVGVTVPENSTVLRSAAAWNGQSISTWTYVYELPIAQFEANGLLDQAPVLAAVSTTQGATSVRAQASPDLVTHPQRRFALPASKPRAAARRYGAAPSFRVRATHPSRRASPGSRSGAGASLAYTSTRWTPNTRFRSWR